MTKEIRNHDIIHPTYFLGSVETYALYFAGTVNLEAHENYQKRSTRNKCFIKTAQGKKSISVPLKSGKNQQQSIREVKISYEELWIKELIHGLETNYSASPYIQYYLPDLIKVIERKPSSLWELNWELNELILHYLDIQGPIKMTQLWQKQYDESSLDLRTKKSTYNLDYEYPQLFEEKGQSFLKNLSIIDLLFCCGPEARLHLMKMADQINP